MNTFLMGLIIGGIIIIAVFIILTYEEIINGRFNLMNYLRKIKFRTIYHCEFRIRNQSIYIKNLDFIPKVNQHLILDKIIYKVVSVTYDIDSIKYNDHPLIIIKIEKEYM